MNKEERKSIDKNDCIHWGQLKNKALEGEYYRAELIKNLRYMKFMLILAGVIYFLFIIPEYFLAESSSAFLELLISRTIVFLLILALYMKLNTSKNHGDLVYWFAIYEVIIAISFIYISSRLNSPNFLIQCFGLMVLILGIFLVNNRWIYTNVIVFLITTAYFIWAYTYFEDLSVNEFLAGIVHLALVIFITSLSSLRINHNRRLQYLNEKALLKMAYRDALTGIYNKEKFNQEYSRLSLRAIENDEKFGLIIFDIDDFKRVNDEHGHLVGDDILVALTKRVQNNIKETDVFARWGGEEFVLIFPGEDLKGARIASERLRRVISDEDFDQVGQVTCSFGVASFKGERDSNLILKRADKRLYQAKNSGKNKVV